MKRFRMSLMIGLGLLSVLSPAQVASTSDTLSPGTIAASPSAYSPSQKSPESSGGLSTSNHPALAPGSALQTWRSDPANSRSQHCSPVPEPATIAAVAIGAGALLKRARRK